MSTGDPGDRRASILHADLDAFYASVEQRDDPSLRGRPVIVGGGVVLAASYEAKRCGIRTAMGGAAARHLCPEAVVVPPRFEAYVEASRKVFDVFHRTTPLVEGISIDEAFLDVGGLRRLAGPAAGIAAKLRADVRAEVGLAITVGIATTKYLAKVASQVAKPDGLLLVQPGHELEFLHPLPVQRLWGCGAKTTQKLHERGVHTVGEVAALPLGHLVAMVGPAAGHHLHALAHNRDPRQVRVGIRRSSIGSQRALGVSRRGPRPPEEVDATVVAIVDRITRRMRTADRIGRTVVLRLRFDDFTRASRSHTLAEPTAHTATVLAAVRSLVAEAWPEIAARGLTLLGVSVCDLGDDDAVQLVLPFDRADGTGPDAALGSALDTALDGVRDRFGAKAVTRGVLVGRNEGWSAPQLPD